MAPFNQMRKFHEEGAAVSAQFFFSAFPFHHRGKGDLLNHAAQWSWRAIALRRWYDCSVPCFSQFMLQTPPI